VKARRSGSLSQSFPMFPRGLTRSESALFRFRFEKAIASLKPDKIKTDPTTGFWTTYKGVADKYDNDLVSNYMEDLDNTLLFVSPFSSLEPFFLLNYVLSPH
jgi:hypothetical protein